MTFRARLDVHTTTALGPNAPMTWERGPVRTVQTTYTVGRLGDIHQPAMVASAEYRYVSEQQTRCHWGLGSLGTMPHWTGHALVRRRPGGKILGFLSHPEQTAEPQTLRPSDPPKRPSDARVLISVPRPSCARPNQDVQAKRSLFVTVIHCGYYALSTVRLPRNSCNRPSSAGATRPIWMHCLSIFFDPLPWHTMPTSPFTLHKLSCRCVFPRQQCNPTGLPETGQLAIVICPSTVYTATSLPKTQDITNQFALN